MARFYLIRPSTLAVLLFTSHAGAASVAEEGDLITPGGEKATFDEVPTPMLLKLRNHAATIGEGKEIKGFRDRAAAVNAAGPILEFLAKPGVPLSAPVSEGSTADSTSAPASTDSAQGAQENTTVARKRTSRAKGAKKTAVKAATKSTNGTGAVRGRPSRFAGMVITRQQKENPRREGTRAFAAWALIKDGMTYESYMEKGGNLEDITREWERKRVKISRKG